MNSLNKKNIIINIIYIIYFFVICTFTLSIYAGKNKNNYLKKSIKTIVKTYKQIDKKKLYKQSSDPYKTSNTNNESGDFEKIQKSSHKDLSTIIVLVGEVPTGSKNGIFAPAILYNKKNIFNSKTDFSLSWVGLKIKGKFKQNNFPFNNFTMQETIIGSFLYASGTNLGFFGEKFNEDLLFYTNYTSQILSLFAHFKNKTIVGFSLDSRQYFFKKKNIPENFIMPKNHYNIFPRLDLNYENYSEYGIDQIFSGILIKNWIGYGIRNRWEEWGSPENLQEGEKAKTFLIYSSTIYLGKIFKNNKNLIVKLKFKGGKDNDFLSQARFGGTIDNAKLDVVHGTTVDQFRVNIFSICNIQYSFDITKFLRANIYFDIAYIIDPQYTLVNGNGLGFRLLGPFGLPIWFTYGISKNITLNNSFQHVFMIMTAAGF